MILKICQGKKDRFITLSQSLFIGCATNWTIENLLEIFPSEKIDDSSLEDKLKKIIGNRNVQKKADFLMI